MQPFLTRVRAAFPGFHQACGGTMEGCLLLLGPSKFRRQQQPPQTSSSRSQRQLIRARLHKVTGGLERDARQRFAGLAFGCINFRPCNSSAAGQKKTKTTYHVTFASPRPPPRLTFHQRKGLRLRCGRCRTAAFWLFFFLLLLFFSVCSRSFPACVG